MWDNYVGNQESCLLTIEFLRMRLKRFRDLEVETWCGHRAGGCVRVDVRRSLAVGVGVMLWGCRIV